VIQSIRNGKRLKTRELSQKEATALPIMRQARDLGQAIGRFAKAARTGEKTIVSPAEMERRLAICRGCQFFQAMRCLKCHCFLSLKARLETEHCPIAKW
jgi:hypothetical protein